MAIKMIKIIDKLPFNQNFKTILDYCFRVLIFLLLNRTSVIEPIGNLFVYIVHLFTKNIEGDDGFITGIAILMFLPLYIIPKICGLFKKLDNLNIFLAIIVILFVDVLFNYSHSLTIQLIPLKFSLSKPHFTFLLIWFFFIYKFLNLLTKIFPVPFKQIGYIFSIELIKDIYKDVKKDIQENYIKKSE